MFDRRGNTYGVFLCQVATVSLIVELVTGLGLAFAELVVVVQSRGRGAVDLPWSGRIHCLFAAQAVSAVSFVFDQRGRRSREAWVDRRATW